MNEFDYISYVLSRFQVKEKVEKIEIITSGHINNTYRVFTKNQIYTVQRVNRFVFKDPKHIMQNIEGVTHFLRAKIREEGGDPERETLRFLRIKNGLNYYVTPDNSFWRVSIYVDHATAYNTVVDSKMLYNAGRSFGIFQRRLSDFPMEKLYETIPDFHNTPKRLQDLFNVAAEDPLEKTCEVETELEFFKSRYEKVSKIVNLQKKGIIPYRVTHNDTKYNNILIDDITHEAICVIDLDTVMPGISCYDFGDAIRFVANTAEEDDPNLDNVHVNMEYFTEFTNGFIGASNGFFTQAEIDCMTLGAISITVELSARFLMDYLLGNKYFKTYHPYQNLDRARNQMRLAMEMENHYYEMQNIVYKNS